MSDVLKLNDVQFVVGPNSISFQQENLSYRFHTLRENGGSKSSSGHGMAIIHMTIPIVKEDIIAMHRLLIEVKRNPFVYIENKLVRHEIVPHWSFSQKMAVTITNIAIETTAKGPGRFNLNITAQWFNYKPYGDNFLFREDWKTHPVEITNEKGKDSYALTINGVKIKEEKATKAGAYNSFEDLKEHWAGGFHSLLTPTIGMQKSNPVDDPARSRIYVRYHNQLQMEALHNNFGITVYNQFEPEHREAVDLGTITLEEALKRSFLFEQTVAQMLAHDYFELSFDVYKMVDIPETFKKTLGANLNDILEMDQKTFAVITQGLSGRPLPANLDQAKAAVLLQEVEGYQRLLNEGSPELVIGVTEVFYRLVTGDNWSGKKYDGKKIQVKEVVRDPNADYGATNSPHKKNPSDGIDVNYYSAQTYLNHFCVDRAGTSRNIAEDYEWHRDNGKLNDPEYIKILRDTFEARLFFIDMGFLVETDYISSLLWGGKEGRDTYPIKSGGQSRSAAEVVRIYEWMHSTEFEGIPDAQFASGAKFTFKDYAKIIKVFEGGTATIDYESVLFPNKGYGSDGVHIGVNRSGRAAATPPAPTTPAVKTNTTAQVGNGIVTSRSWYEAIDALSEVSMSRDDIEWLKAIRLMRDSGWTYYKENTTTGIFFKKVKITVPTTTGFQQKASYDSGRDSYGAQIASAAIYDGSPEDFDTILTGISYSCKHLITSIPILGSQYPTSQHLGSLDGTYSFEFATQSRDSSIGSDEFKDINFEPQKRDGMGITAQFIKYALATCAENGRTIKNIYDSWMFEVDNFFTRFTGIKHQGSYSSDNPHVHNPTMRKLICGAAATQSIPHLAGMSSLVLECEESKPYIKEDITNVNSLKKSTKEAAYRTIVKKMLSSGVSVSNNQGLYAPGLLEAVGTTAVNSFPYLAASNTYNAYNSPPSNSKTYSVYDVLTDISAQMVRYPANEYALIGNDSAAIISLPTGGTVQLPAQESFVYNGGITSYLTPSDEQIITRLTQIGMATSENAQNVKGFYSSTFRELLFGSYVLTEKELSGFDIGAVDLYGMEKHVSPYLTRFTLNALSTSTITMWGWLTGIAMCFMEDLAQELAEAGIAIGDFFASIFTMNELSDYLWDADIGIDSLMDRVNTEFGSSNLTLVLTAILFLLKLIVGVLKGIGILVSEIIEYIYKFIVALYNFEQEFAYYALAGLIPFNLLLELVLNYIAFLSGIETWGASGDSYYKRSSFRLVFSGSILAALKMVAPFSEQESNGTYYNAIDSAGALSKALIGDNSFFTSQFGLLDSITAVINQSYFKKGGPDLSYENVKAPVSQVPWESNKARSLKASLEFHFSKCLQDPLLIKYFDLEDEAEAFLDKIVIDKKDCLPDLMLPRHPLYGSTHMTPPDFFYWNESEDGKALSIEQASKTYNRIVDAYVSKTSNFMQQMMNGDVSKLALSNTVEIENGLSQFDGSDNLIATEFLTDAQSGGFGFTGPSGQIDALRVGPELNSVNFKETASGSPSGTASGSFHELTEKIKEVELQFGKREGFTNEDKVIDDFFESRGEISQYHRFDSKSLQDIAKESAKDLYSNKMRMSRSVPAYRLYIIEEDEGEDFLTKYDDFFSYDAVKEITIVRNREVAGDTAVIVLQNLSGTLDGNKRLSIRDVDYLSENRTATGQSTTMGVVITEARKAANQNTVDEEVFTSVVLRPGTNMQIRMGYGNNAEALEVKLSGRITDINKSVNGDLIEIIVQSFGVELEQQLKGLSITGEAQSYNMTHKLLGALMFEPELKHFGRWEKYVKAQYGEDKSSDYDLANYAFTSFSPSSFFGTLMPHTSNALSMWWKNVGYSVSSAGNLSPISALYGSVSASARMLSAPVTALWDIAMLPVRAALAPFKSAADFLDKEITYNSAKVMNKPQDDNIFAPNPKDYLYKEKTWLQSWREFAGNFHEKGIFYAALAEKYDQEIVNSLKGEKEKMTYQDLVYQLNNVTIWQVFKEMTLRHPGYVYAAVPYGKEFRYTMFFGLPSQRYWARPGSPLLSDKLNKIRTSGAATQPLGNDYSVKPHVALQSMMRSIFGSNHIDKSSILVGDTSGTPITPNFGSNGDHGESPFTGMEKLGVKTVGDALSYYLEALTYRFEPFRRYHLVTSGRDLSLNTLGVSNYNGANTAAVKYYNK